MRAVRTRMTIPPVMEDIAAMLAFVDVQPAAKPGPVGAHGYCMSGPYALAAAARYPDRITAAASFYGTWLVNDAEESPHRNLAKAKGELYIACAEHDELAPLPMVEELPTCSNAPAQKARSNCTPRCITASPSPSAGATTSRPRTTLGTPDCAISAAASVTLLPRGAGGIPLPRAGERLASSLRW